MANRRPVCNSNNILNAAFVAARNDKWVQVPLRLASLLFPSVVINEVVIFDQYHKKTYSKKHCTLCIDYLEVPELMPMDDGWNMETCQRLNCNLALKHLKSVFGDKYSTYFQIKMDECGWWTCHMTR